MPDPLLGQSASPAKGTTSVSTEALDELMAAIPPYFGLAVPLEGERDGFNAAEGRLAAAYQRVRSSMMVGF